MAYKYSANISSELLNRIKPTNEEQKVEAMREKINKTQHRLFSDYWRNHVAVSGWTTMNYPSRMKKTLVPKYEGKIERLKQSYQREKDLISQEDQKAVAFRKSKIPKHYRSELESVNKHIIDEIKDLVKPDNPSEKFLDRPFKQEDFFSGIFKKMKNQKENFKVNEIVPFNYNYAVELGRRTFLYALGYKFAFASLTSNAFEKRQGKFDFKYHFDKKYCTIYPKSVIIGEKPDTTYSKKAKKIGDISFEEEVYEAENVKNMLRWTPDNLNSESIKDNLNSKVEILRIDNHFWLSQDLLSKLGRLDPMLKVLSLRNLEIENPSLENILRNTTM